MYDIEEMKLLLVNSSTKEFLAALPSFDMQCQDKYGNNILHYYIKLCANSVPPATVNDWKLIIKSLLEVGVSIEEKQQKGNGHTPLHMAVSCHLQDITSYLIELKADVNATNSNGMPILFTALMSNDEETIDYFIDVLLKSGADENFKLPDGETVKEFALRISNQDYAKHFHA